jgi:cytochrome c
LLLVGSVILKAFNDLQLLISDKGEGSRLYEEACDICHSALAVASLAAAAAGLGHHPRLI